MKESPNHPESALAFPSRLAGIDGPWLPTLLFGPVSLLLLTGALVSGDWHGTLVWGLAGLGLWTLLEYLFHRFGHWIHHEGRSRGWGLWTEGLHWTHHDHPEDPNHFITRPSAVLILGAIIFLLFLATLPNTAAALAMEGGTLLGYLAYEWVHFRAHRPGPTTGLSRYWKRYHLHHHYSHQEICFGVTTPLWDWILAKKLSSWSKLPPHP